MSDEGRPAEGDWIRSAVARYERPLVAYAAHVLGGDVERARDVAQETFVRLCSQDRAKVEPHLAEWLFTVARNQAIDVRRKERRMGLLSDADADKAASEAPAPGDAIERQEAVSQVLRSIEMLPDNQQECIRLKFQHGLSYKQISQVTKLSVSNVGFLIHTGLKTLRKRLGESAGAAALRGGVPSTR